MPRVVFYCNDIRPNLDLFEYYKQDIDALIALENEVIICTKYREIPLDFDAMFIWWWTYALYPVLLCRILNKPCIITGVFNFRFPERYNGIDYFRRPFWQRFLISKAVTLSTLNLFINEAESRGCSDYFRLRNARFYPCTIHDDYMQGPSLPRRNVLFNLACSGKQNLVRKGIPDLLNAMRILKDENVDVCLNLAGLRGDGADFLSDLIKKLDIQDYVKYLGKLSREEKIDYFRSCEIYVQPSLYEGFGLATAEAMGCGACVITCGVGAVRSVVGDCGVYVAPGSPQELAQAIKQVIFNDTLRQDFQSRAFKRAQECFAFNKKLESLRGYLSEVGIS